MQFHNLSHLNHEWHVWAFGMLKEVHKVHNIRIFFALLADTVPVLVIVADFSGCDCAETREEDERQFLNPSLKILS